MKTLKHIYAQQPVVVILTIALLVRMLAAIFSQGYAMHDDHFLIIESSSSWSDGYDYNKWLPATQQDWVERGLKDEVRPEGHSLVYPGVHYLLFESFNFLGLDDPKAQMLVIRILHALFGVWLVYLVYHLAGRITTAFNARLVAWVSALGWAMAFLSVRNLVEIVCIPFLILALMNVHKGMFKAALRFGFWAGLCMAMAVAIRYQLLIFVGVLGLVLLVQKRWKLSLGIILGFVLGFGVLQGLLDYLIWGYPFAEMLEYFIYNSSEARFDYAAGNSSFFGLNYWLVLSFITVPFIGGFWFFGFFTQWRKQAWLFFPALAFLLFHMSYVNVQERFIFPIMHVVLILGVMGWQEFASKSKFWSRRQTILSGLTQFSCLINFILFLFITTYYGKKARVEASYALHNQSEYFFAVQESTVDGFIPMMPVHYIGNWDFEFYPVTNEGDWLNYASKFDEMKGMILFHGNDKLHERIAKAELYLGPLVSVGTHQPSWQDRLIQWLNPVNRNDAIHAFRVK